MWYSDSRKNCSFLFYLYKILFCLLFMSSLLFQTHYTTDNEWSTQVAISLAAVENSDINVTIHECQIKKPPISLRTISHIFCFFCMSDVYHQDKLLSWPTCIYCNFPTMIVFTWWGWLGWIHLLFKSQKSPWVHAIHIGTSYALGCGSFYVT